MQKDTTYSTYSLNVLWPIPVAARSKAWPCGRSLAGIAGSSRRGHGCLSLCEGCVLSGKMSVHGQITRPEESYRVCVCVCVCDGL